MNPRSENFIYQTVFDYTKIYSTFLRIFKYASPIKARIEGYELVNSSQTSSSSSPFTDKEQNLLNSLRRSKTAIADLVLSNEFDLFVTFTFAKNREDINSVKKRMSKWLKNQKEIHGKFSYLIVPEFHKDRKAIHFHGLLKDYRGVLKNSGITQNGRDVYNITSYRLGFSTAVKIDDHAKVSSYIRKYITKDMPQFEGKKRYWSSKDLARPLVVPNQAESYVSNPYLDFTTEYETKTLTVLRTDVTMHLPNKSEDILWKTQTLQT